jgi:hypothetical protein
MLNQNVPAKFQTELDSTYTVDAMSVTRHKPADPSRETKRQEKNIYYLLKSGDGKEVLSDLNKGYKYPEREAGLRRRVQAGHHRQAG